MANYANCYGHCLEKPIWENDFGKTECGKPILGKNDVGKNDFGNTDFGKTMLEKSSGFPDCFYPNKIVIAFFSKLCFCQLVFWPTVVFQNQFFLYMFLQKRFLATFFSFKIPFVARHNCHVHTADSNQSNFHFFFLSLATAYM